MSTERGSEEEDAAFIDRLYGGEDVGGLGTVRGLIARVREEQPGVEPPQAIGAKLLLAAQEHAPKKPVTAEAKPGWWARLSAWMRPVMAHPGMAAAATLVVVAGATAVWMSRGGKVEEPTMRAETRAPAEEAEGAGSGMVAGADTATVTTESAPAAAAAPEPAPARDEKQQAAPTRTATVAPTTKTPARDAAAPAKKKPAPKPDLAKRSGGGEAASGAAFGDSAADDGVEREPAAGVKAKVGAPAQQPAAPPPPPAPAAAPQKPAESKKNDEAPPSRVRQLLDQARAAAKQGDCDRVDAIGAEVKKLDASYYAKTFSTDASISACRKPAAE